MFVAKLTVRNRLRRCLEEHFVKIHRPNANIIGGYKVENLECHKMFFNVELGWVRLGVVYGFTHEGCTFLETAYDNYIEMLKNPRSLKKKNERKKHELAMRK